MKGKKEKIKIKNEELVFLQIEKQYTLEINGKEVKVNKWQKEDPFFSDYDSDYEIKEDCKNLTEIEKEEIMDFVSDLNIMKEEKERI